MKPNGYVLFETPLLAIIATGFRRKTANLKTGDMVQVWTLNRYVHPVQAQRTGLDKATCGKCPLRPILAKGTRAARCYVQTDKAPAAIYRAYHRGSYPQMKTTDVFLGKAVRFGAYGEPTKLPLSLLKEIARKAARWTGYTHQWANPIYRGYAPFLMASADSLELQQKANSAGWRTFRVAPKGDTERMADEISCPASAEAGKKTTCAKCTLCRGNGISAKSIVIQAH